MTQRELKRIAQKALTKENGYPAPQSAITIQAVVNNGQYIQFIVGNCVYSWDSVTMAKTNRGDLK